MLSGGKMPTEGKEQTADCSIIESYKAETGKLEC